LKPATREMTPTAIGIDAGDTGDATDIFETKLSKREI
jgi:hypothetical protein